LWRLTAATGGGMFIDGFVFATFAAAFAGRATDALHVTSLWEQWISASVLIGTFFGGIGLGYVTDRIGRRPMFTIDLSVFTGCAVLMFFVQSPWQVFAIGVVMGLAVGADYSIGSPLLGEFGQAKSRGNYLGVLEISWNVGYVVAYLIGYLINTHQPGAWRFILCASVIPAVICLFMRHGLPESPRWLISKGRRDEALAIMRDHMEAADPGDMLDEEVTQTRWQQLFSPDYLRRTIFACTFWSAIVLPYFALTFFQPTILTSLGLGGNALLGALLGTVIALVGATVGWFIVDKVGRRKILVPPMFVCAAFLLLAAAQCAAGANRRHLLLRLPVLLRRHVDSARDLSGGDLPQLGARDRRRRSHCGQPGGRRARYVPAADHPVRVRHAHRADHHGRGVADRRGDVVLLGSRDQRPAPDRHIKPRRFAPVPAPGGRRPGVISRQEPASSRMHRTGPCAPFAGTPRSA
jgi:MFS family permease